MAGLQAWLLSFHRVNSGDGTQVNRFGGSGLRQSHLSGPGPGFSPQALLSSSPRKGLTSPQFTGSHCRRHKPPPLTPAKIPERTPISLTCITCPDPSRFLSERKWDSVIALYVLISGWDSGVDTSPAHPKDKD